MIIDKLFIFNLCKPACLQQYKEIEFNYNTDSNGLWLSYPPLLLRFLAERESFMY